MIAAQLYTVRDECEIDFLSTLEKIKALGFDGVEFAGFYNHKVSEIKEKLDELELIAVSSHVMMDQLEDKLDEVIDFHLVLGCNHIVCPYGNWTTDQELDQFIKSVSQISSILEEKGMILHYHNHDHEFKTKESSYELDYLINQSNIKLELDACWASFADVNPIDYYNSQKENIELMHLKDLEEGDVFKPTSLGLGTIDIRGLIDVSKTSVSWFIVENDYPVPDGLTNLKQSMTYLIEENLI